MTRQRGTTVAIVTTLALAATAGGLALMLKPARPVAEVAPTAPQSPLMTIAEGISRGDQAALTTLCQQVVDHAGTKPVALTDAEAAEYVAVLEGLKTGFVRYVPVGRASAVAAASHILQRFKVEPSPAAWFDTLRPSYDIFAAGLADVSLDVRVSALNEVGHSWNWLPGCAMTPAQEKTLAQWKDDFYKPAKDRLGDREPRARAAAVVCLGALPIDTMAAPAAAYVHDPESGGVRYKALMTFANRPNLLAIDEVLKRLHDSEPGVPELAELILKGRGLDKDQIYLGRQMFDVKAEVRASVIPLLHQRTDIDPDVWLIQLSHDTDEIVRTRAVEALSDRDSPEVNRRLREIASTDTSATIRASAGKHVAKRLTDATALPPLPGSPGQTIRGN